jgi:RNA polymerase sigma-70 factor (ECF subfamily)
MKLEQIWHQYEISLRSFLYKNLKNQSDVDDILQDVMLKTHQNLHTLSDVSKLKSWLFQIANNAMMDFYRKQRPSEEVTDEHLGFSESEVSLIEQMGPCIEPFINCLPQQQKELLIAVDIEGISQKEYALSVGENYSTIKSRAQKSRNSLYELFNQCCSFTRDAQGNLLDMNKRANCQVPGRDGDTTQHC